MFQILQILVSLFVNVRNILLIKYLKECAQKQIWYDFSKNMDHYE